MALTGSSSEKSRSKVYGVIESIFFLLLILLTGYILLNSPVFEVNRVVVQGNEILSDEKIIDIAGIGTGYNIFKQDLASAANNLSLVPLIKEARVARSLPATVLISIEERQPVAILAAGEALVEVDGEGVYLQKASAGRPGLPVLTGIYCKLPGPGQRVVAEDLAETLAVITGLPEETVAGFSEVHTGGDGQIIIYTVEGIQCRFGPPSDIKEKGAVLSGLLAELRPQGARVEYIDLSYSGRPVVFYKKN